MQIRTLYEFCSDIIGKLTGAQLHFFSNSFSDEQRYLFSTTLPLDLPLELTLSLKLDEEYWKRKCFLNQWNRINYWLNDCSWRKTFFSYYAGSIVDNFIAQRISFSEVEESLFNIHNCLHSLKINGYKFNYTNFNSENINSRESIISLEENLTKLLNLFPNLEEICFYNFPINIELFEGEHETVKKLDSQMISYPLSKMKSLRKLSIIGTPTKYVNFFPLITNLIHLNIVDLNLSCDQIGNDFCEPISKLIQQTQLQSLTLSCNNITCVGAQQIAFVLKENQSLRVLKLDRNLIADEGAISIGHSLVFNKSLLKLDVAYNKMSSECSCAFSGLLTRNDTLQSLNLAANNLGKESGRVLCEDLQVNNSLLTLSCQFCGFDEEIEDLIYLRLLENYKTHLSLKNY